MKLVTVQEMQQLEKAADAAGHAYDTMMELAGQAVAELIQSTLDVRDKRASDPGRAGQQWRRWTGRRPLPGPSRRARRGLSRQTKGRRRSQHQSACKARDVGWLSAESDAGGQALRKALQNADVLVDALLGTGVDRPIKGTLAEILDAARQDHTNTPDRSTSHLTYLGAQTQRRARPARPTKRPLIVAVDVPSGVNCDTGAVDPVTLPADRDDHLCRAPSWDISAFPPHKSWESLSWPTLASPRR